MFGDEIAKDRVRAVVEDVIRWKTIYGDDYQMTEQVIKHEYPDVLTEEQLKAVRRLRYTGWGNFSAKFLNGIEGVNKETGEVYTIIQALWETNCNLMQLLSSDFTFAEEIARHNDETQGEVKEISYEALVEDLIVSPAIKRALWQTVQIVEEIRHVMGSDPDKIFVEMPVKMRKKIKTARASEKIRERPGFWNFT